MVCILHRTVESNMDQQREQIKVDSNSKESRILTPSSIKTSHLGRDYKELRSILEKKNNVFGTVGLLAKCIATKTVPKGFNQNNLSQYEELCQEHQDRWLESTFIKINIALEHHSKRFDTYCKVFEQKKILSKLHLCSNMISSQIFWSRALRRR